MDGRKSGREYGKRREWKRVRDRKIGRRIGEREEEKKRRGREERTEEDRHRIIVRIV